MLELFGMSRNEPENLVGAYALFQVLVVVGIDIVRLRLNSISALSMVKISDVYVFKNKTKFLIGQKFLPEPYDRISSKLSTICCLSS